jgi:hypothetical protein
MRRGGLLAITSFLAERAVGRSWSVKKGEAEITVY